MPTVAGPNTKGEENLVFGYDLGDVSNSYKGEPVANDFNFSLFTPSGYGGDGTLQPNALDPFGTTDNPVYRKTGKLRFGPTNGTDVGTLYYGKTYTFSIYLRFVQGESTWTGGEFDLYDRSDSRNFSGGLGDNMTYEWKRFSVTAYHNNNSNYHFVDIGHYQGTNVFEWCCPQIEENDHMTTFTPHGSPRSATQGLLDLTGNSTIDLTNVSFDSNAQMTFDGTDDRISIPAGAIPTIGTSDFTMEFVCKNTKTSSYNHFFSVKDQYHFSFKASNSSGILYAYRTSALSTTNTIEAYIPSRTSYYHIVLKRSGDSLEIFVNGVSQGTKSGWGNEAIENNLYTSYIGWGNASEYTGGEIPIAKLYNRALSASEIQSNFNAIRGRFNI